MDTKLFKGHFLLFGIMKNVVVIGGGFAGAYIAKHLEKDFAVTLIDTKDYFEFTPGILRTIVHPRHMKKIQVLHSHYLHTARIIRAEVTNFDEKEVVVGAKKFPFDYLFVCSGSRYNSPIKEKNVVLPNRAHALRKAHQDLVNARTVLIVGGGVVGVELAAEIVDFYPEKDVLLVHSKETLLERNPKKAQHYAERYLKQKRVEIIYRERMDKHEGSLFFTSTGRKIHADLCFLCTGITPNMELFQEHFASCLNERKQVLVEKTLQMKGFPHIFVVGDLNDCQEEKTAQSAEKQACVVVKNLFALERGEHLHSYSSTPKPMVISLGRFSGILCYKNFVFTGFVVAFLKWFVEWKTMVWYRS